MLNVMTSVILKGRSWVVLLLVVTAVITTQSYATDQHETFNSVDKTNGLEDPLAITIADRLVLALAGLEQLVRENAELKNALADVKRFQVEADSKIQRLTEEIVQMKEQMREDGTYVRSGLKALASNAAAGQLRRGETKRQSDSTDETGEITRDVAEVKRQLKKVVTDNSQMKISLQFAMGNVSQHLQQLNRTVAAAMDSSKQNGFCANVTKPRDCGDILSLGSTSSGVYTVFVGNKLHPISVYCDMETDNGGWTVFQRRQDGSENFYRNWLDYAKGFGNLSGEFWLGNDKIHLLTTNGRRYRLRVDLIDFDGNTRYAEYSTFTIGSSLEKYRMVSLGTYSGTAGNALKWNKGMHFSTFDQDNDESYVNCAVEFKGAWWYKTCHLSNLNGHYYRGAHESYADGVEWYPWTGYYYSLKFTEMKIRFSQKRTERITVLHNR